jgi:hypothetical protein
MAGHRTPDPSRVRTEFFDLGVQYFIAARFAASAHLLPVTGNLFHHAIEMMIKGELATHIGERERRRLSHDLNKLWKEFKRRTNRGQSLDSFDNVITRLAQFEDIRFPEAIVSKGMTCVIGFGEFAPTDYRDGHRGPRYELFVGEVDALVKAILEVSHINPVFFTSRYHTKHARTYLRRYNRRKKTRLW